MKRATLLGLAAALICGPALAQSQDPYAADQHASIMRDLHDEAVVLGSAGGCQVVTDAQAFTLMRRSAEADTAVGDQYGQDIEGLEAAFHLAQFHARAPGACAGWHKHPELVSMVRNDVQQMVWANQ